MRLFGRVIGTASMELVFHHSKNIDENNLHNTGGLQQPYLQAFYDLPFDGEYNVSIEVRYLDFDPHNISSSSVYCTDNEILSNYSMTVVMKSIPLNLPFPHRNECTSSTIHHLGGHHGFWKKSNSSIPMPMAAKVQLVSNSETDLEPQHERIRQVEGVLTYQPRHCDILQFGDPKLHTVSSSPVMREICIVGDSHMRHLRESLVAIIEGRWSDLLSGDSSFQSDKKVTFHEHISYIMDNWAEMKFSDADRTGQSGHVRTYIHTYKLGH